MNRKLFHNFLSGILFVFLIGTLLHFVYQWTGENFLAGLISPVNESTWEHMKLLFFPMLIFSIFLALRWEKDYPCIVSGLCTGLLLGSILIPVLFYTYSGILGKNYMALDILIFLIAVVCAFCCAYRLTLSCRLGTYTRLLEVAVFVLLICFLTFTYYPPPIGLFQDPLGG